MSSKSRTIAIGAATIASAALWALELPGHAAIPNWFYRIDWRPLAPSPWALVLALAIVPLGALALRLGGAGRHGRGLAVLVLTGMLAQSATFLLVGPDLAGTLQRFTDGHTQFLDHASRHTGRRLETLQQYDELAASGALGEYAPSKPPGTLAYYELVAWVSESSTIQRAVTPLRRLAAARDLRARPEPVAVALVALPLTSALVALPLVLLGLALAGRASVGYAAALLWLTSPLLHGLTHNADGSIYTLLAVTGCAVAGLGARRGSLALSSAGGAFLLVAFWCSFGMLPVIALAIGVQIVALADRDRSHLVPRAIAHGAALLAGFALALLALHRFGLFDDPIASMRLATHYHTLWKVGLVGGLWGLTGGLEFWAWLGLPMLVALAIAVGRGARELATSGRLPLALAGLGFVAVHVGLMLAGGSNESARLWTFQVPFVASVIALDIARGRPAAAANRLVLTIVVANVVLVPFLRSAQV